MNKSRKSHREYIIFDMLTKSTIIVMILYIVIKLMSIMMTGDTREVLLIETRQWALKTIKNIVYNEVLNTDDYLTENKIIYINTSNSNIQVDNSVQKIIASSNDYKEKVISQVKNKINSTIENTKSNIDTTNVKESYGDGISGKVLAENFNSVQKKLMIYKTPSKKLQKNISIINTLKEQYDVDYMLRNFYLVDGETSVDRKVMNPKRLLGISNKLVNKNNTEINIEDKSNIKYVYPQILIYHTHASEKYVDSKNRESDTVVGVANELEKILEKSYGYNVLHIKNKFDVVNNKWNRNAYDTALPSIKKVLNKYPSIEVVIDLHRDSGKEKLITDIGGVKVAKVMLFNGVSRTNIGDRKEIPNHNLAYNLAFSLDIQIESKRMYADFIKKNYIKGYRYNMHLVKKSLLVEVGNDKNTVLEAKYAMVPFAKILNKVLTTN